jgi:alkylation response protein AidB-like acyl-CoA dehydrogenase
MDFNLDETQQEIADLALRILDDRVDHNRLKEIEAGPDWFDRETYLELAKSGLVGIALREDVGGGGMTLIEAALVVEQQGRTVAPMPLLPTIVAALALDEFGSSAQRTRYLPGVCDGSIVLSIALQEYLNDNPLAPTATAKKSGSSWVITGEKVMVEGVTHAHRILVAARAGRGIGVFLIDPTSDGVSTVRGVTTRKEPVHELHLDGVVATDVIGSTANGADILSFVHQRALALLCATQVGVTDRQLRLTAKYASERHQFGRPIATFQAVTQRLANCYIDVEAVRLTTYSALWRLANGFAAADDLRIAKWFASDQAHLVAHACQHIHGGAGVDVENPQHRYTLWNKHIEGSLGAGTASLRSLGQLLAG